MSRVGLSKRLRMTMWPPITPKLHVAAPAPRRKGPGTGLREGPHGREHGPAFLNPKMTAT
jgi:hypothetical protein